MAVQDPIIASLSQQIGDKSLVPFSDTDNGNVYDWLITGLPQVDATLHGGIPLSGRFTQIYGDPNVGKSTFVMNEISIGQRVNLIAIYFDVEGTTNNTRLKELGVDPAKVLTKVPTRNSDGTVNPLTIEDIMENMSAIAAAIHQQDKNRVAIFIWDTVGMTQSRNVADSEFGAQWVGNQAKALSEGIRKLNANMIANNGNLIALNQARDDLQAPNPKYAKSKTVGGKAWQHEMTYSLYMRKGKDEMLDSKSTVPIGHAVTIQLKKSKLGAATGDAVTAIMLADTGFDIPYNLLATAQETGLITKGAWKTYNALDGTEYKFHKADWLNFFKSKEGTPVFYEIYQRLVKGFFPTCYPALFNTHAILTDEAFPEFIGLRDYYIDIQEKLPEEEQHAQYKLWKESTKPKRRKAKK